MKKFILNLVVKDNITLNNQYSLLILTSDDPLPPMLPGQFAEIRVDNSPNTFLRRPISINFVDTAKNEPWLLIQKVGDGTKKLCEAKSGEIMNLVVPLGNSFSLPENIEFEVIRIAFLIKFCIESLSEIRSIF